MHGQATRTRRHHHALENLIPDHEGCVSSRFLTFRDIVANEATVEPSGRSWVSALHPTNKETHHQHTGHSQDKVSSSLSPLDKCSEIYMAIYNNGDHTAHTLTLAIFGSHGISIETIGTSFTVGAVRVPQALEAFPRDRVTVASLQGIHIAAAVARYAGSPWHCWVSIVTVCTSVSGMESRI